MRIFSTISSLFVLFHAVYSTCESPQVSSSTYTTEDVTILSHVAYIADFKLACYSGGSVNNLYVLLGDAITPVGRVGPQHYQISWIESVNNARVGDIQLKIYDDDGFAVLKKTQRLGESVENVAPLTTVTVHHPGIYKGPWISCECLAVAFSLVVSYYAIHFRSKLLA